GQVGTAVSSSKPRPSSPGSPSEITSSLLSNHALALGALKSDDDLQKTTWHKWGWQELEIAGRRKSLPGCGNASALLALLPSNRRCFSSMNPSACLTP